MMERKMTGTRQLSKATGPSGHLYTVVGSQPKADLYARLIEMHDTNPEYADLLAAYQAEVTAELAAR